MSVFRQWLFAANSESNSNAQAVNGPEVIAVGLPRTGTKSLQDGLTRLGFGPAYHMGELAISDRGVQDAKEWLKAYRGEPADMKRVLKGYRSTLDAPSVDFFEELMALYPDAKVILQTRDGEAWAKSVDESIGSLYHPPYNLALWDVLPNAAYQRRVGLQWFARAERNRRHDMDPTYMARWIKHVKERVPREKLMVWNVKEGYAPLSKFLGVPVIDEPFPHANDKEQLLLVFKAFLLVVHLITAAWVMSIGSVVYSLYKVWTLGIMAAWVVPFGIVSFFLAIVAQLQPALTTRILLGPFIGLVLYGVYIVPIAAGSAALLMNRARLGF